MGLTRRNWHSPVLFTAHQYRRRGFTLVELLVVMALAGVLLAIVPPLLSAALPGVELKAAARRTAASLQLAREIAISRGQAIIWQLNTATREYQIDGDQRVGHLPTGIECTLVVAEREMQTDDQGGIRFFPDGSASGGRIILQRGQRGYQVGVNWLTGRIVIADWQETD